MCQSRSYGDIIRKYRLRKGWDQARLAAVFSVSRNTISNWENDLSRPGIAQLAALCGALDMPAAEFLGLPDTDRLSESEAAVLDAFRSLTPRGRNAARNILSELLAHETAMLAEAPGIPVLRLPVVPLGAAAGLGVPSESVAPSEYLLVRITDDTSAADAVYTVNGPSMEPDLRSGDLVLVRYAASLRENEIGIFTVNGETYIKEYRNDGLHSRNPAWPVMRFGDGDDVRCIGQVIAPLPPENIVRPGGAHKCPKLSAASKR